MMVDSKRIAFHLDMGPDEVRRVTVRHDEPIVTRLVLMAPASGLEVTAAHFDADAYGLQFKAPSPKDIIYCESCGEWHEQGKAC